MRIIKKINTSAALALDSAGREIVVLGKGVGFPPVPYELTDISRVERTFYDIDPKYLSMIAELPQSIVLASADIADLAEIELNCRLNPNLPFTLADHLNFAVERLKSGIDLTNPIAYDIRHLYPKESALADQALEILKEQNGLLKAGKHRLKKLPVPGVTVMPHNVRTEPRCPHNPVGGRNVDILGSRICPDIRIVMCRKAAAAIHPLCRIPSL